VEFWVFLGAALYALEGTAFILPIQLAMKDKSKGDQIVIRSSIFVGLLYLSFGIIGYLTYGDSAMSVITLNLKQENPHDKSVVALQIGYVFALLLAYPVTLYPAIRIIEPRIFKDKKSRSITLKKNLLRTGLVLFTGVAAIGGSDQFDNFIGLIGGLACVPLTLIYPALFHLKIFKPYELSPREKWENYIIIVLGTLGCLATTISCIYQWISQSDAGDPPCVPI